MKDIQELAGIWSAWLAAEHNNKVIAVETWKYENTPALARYKDQQVCVNVLGSTNWETITEETITDDMLPVMLGSYDWSNVSASTIQEKFSFDQDITSTVAWTWTEGLTINSETEFAFSVPFLGSGKEKFGVTFKGEHGQTNTKTETMKYLDETMITIPPHTHSWGNKQLKMGKGKSKWSKDCVFDGHAVIWFESPMFDDNNVIFVSVSDLILNIQRAVMKPELTDGYIFIKQGGNITGVKGLLSGTVEYEYAMNVIGSSSSIDII